MLFFCSLIVLSLNLYVYAGEIDNKKLQDLEAKQKELSLHLQNVLERLDAQADVVKLQQAEIVKLKQTCGCEPNRSLVEKQKGRGDNRTDTSTKKREYDSKLEPGIRARSPVGGNVPVAFSSFLDHSVEHLGMDHPIVYNRVLLNIGSAYNSQSGMFTCPMDGVYVFYFSVSTFGVHQIVAKIVVDGANQVDAISDTYHDSHEAQGGNLVIISLKRGQQVWVANYRWPDKSMQESNNSRFSTFSGFLL